MGNIIWLSVAILGLVAVIAGAYLFRGHLGSDGGDHRDPFLPLGVTFTVIGLGIETSALWILGIVFMIAGAVNRRRPRADSTHDFREFDRRTGRKAA